MHRYFLWVEYRGDAFYGWQRQEQRPSVQGAIEGAIFQFTGERVTLQAAGRTDTGVHARAQVAHADLFRARPIETIRSALNHFLRPKPVVILEAREVDLTLHARFSAIRRHYRYLAVARRAPLALDEGFAWHVASDLNVEAMHEAAQSFVGHHDFSSFRSADCQARSPMKTLDRFTVQAAGDRISFACSSRSFLHHQVRNMVGTLVQVGSGRWPIGKVAEVMAAKDRRAAGPTAPAHGLTFLGVEYPRLHRLASAEPGDREPDDRADHEVDDDHTDRARGRRLERHPRHEPVVEQKEKSDG